MENTIAGVQHNGVQTCSKHYIGNEQETQRTNSTDPDGTPEEAISSHMSERTLWELYLWPFANAVKAGTTSIMCSYNRFNGTCSCENSELLNNILKKELGFEGYAVSDWYATHSAVGSANAGLDLEMPGYSGSQNPSSSTWYSTFLVEAVKNGSITADRLDEMVARIMTPYSLLGQDSADYPTPRSHYAIYPCRESIRYRRSLGLGLSR